MLKSKPADPSPFRAGLLHGFLSVGIFAGVAAIAGGIIHVTGDPAEAGPQQVIALFEAEGEGEAPALRTRLANGASPAIIAAQSTSPAFDDGTEPSLNVADPSRAEPAPSPGRTAAAPAQTQTQTAEAAPTRGIRINGRLVEPGQRYSQVQDTAPNNSQSTRATGGSLQVRTNTATTRSADEISYARPFENPQGKPVVSIIVGGLGTSYRQSISMIDELPPEVTLSFVPTANNELLRYARRKGHEILLEVPMEPLERGRARAHPDMLLANSNGESNVLRIQSLLRGRRELYGVISQKGGKFVKSDGDIAPVFAHLERQNMAFFQHSTLTRTNFADAAAALNLPFAAAEENIDTEIRASDIEAKLFQLETQALDQGLSFGTGFAYPQTVDIVSRWARRLNEKGILLAPASYVAAQTASQPVSDKTSQLALNDTLSDPSP